MKKIIVIILGLMLLCGCGKEEEIKKEYENINVNTKENVIKDQSVGELTFTNTSLIEEDGISTLTTTITNSSSEAKEIMTFKILVKNRQGNVVTELLGYVGGTIQPGESKVVTTSITSTLSDAYSIEYKLTE